MADQENRRAAEKIRSFRSMLKDGKCPFCGMKLEYYDGALGYEAWRCYRCSFETDHSGMRFMEDDLKDKTEGGA